MNAQIVTAADNPQLVSETQKRIGAEWPEFMLHDPVADLLADCYRDLPGFQFVMTVDDLERPVAIANSIPLRWEDELKNLPDEGWDWALTTGLQGYRDGTSPNYLCALQIVVFSENRGKGYSSVMVEAMKRIGKEAGLTGLIAPVRPSRKCDFPSEPIDAYIQRHLDDGRLFDPWLRVHNDLGAAIIKPCPKAMRIEGTVSEWCEWTGMSFTKSGSHIVPGALVPVQIDLESDRGLYLEPNVWMIHR